MEQKRTTVLVRLAEFAAVCGVLGRTLGGSARLWTLVLGLWLLFEVASAKRVWPLLGAQQRPIRKWPSLFGAFLERCLLWCGFCCVLSLWLLLSNQAEPQALAVLLWRLFALFGPLSAGSLLLSLRIRMGSAFYGEVFETSQTPSSFAEHLWFRAQVTLLMGLFATAQQVLLFAVLLGGFVPRAEVVSSQAFPMVALAMEWAWFWAAFWMGNRMLAQLKGPLAEDLWRKVIHNLLLWPSRLSTVHAVLTYVFLMGGVFWLFGTGQVLSHEVRRIFGVLVVSESVAALWLGLSGRRSLRPLFPVANQKLSMQALLSLRPPPLSGQVLLLQSGLLVGFAMWFLPSEPRLQVWVLLLCLLSLPVCALLLSFLHRKLLGRSGGTVPMETGETGDPEEQLRVWLLQAEQSVLGKALRTLEKELAVRLSAAEEAARLLQSEVEQRTRELSLQQQALQHTLAEVSELQARLIDSERLTSVERFLANVVHEINNPANAILNAGRPLHEALAEEGGCLAKGTGDETERRAFLDDAEAMLRVVRRGVRRTVELLRSLHPASGESSFESMEDSQPVDLEECLRAAWSLCQGPGKECVAIEWQLVKTEGEHRVPAAFQQVFTNLFSNAVFALCERLETDEQAPAATLCVRTARVDDEVLVEIADNGIGMTTEVRRRLFEPFFSTKDAAHGTGLGLSIALGIVRKWHGRIEVSSSPRQGTTFTVYFPVKGSFGQHREGSLVNAVSGLELES
ncbi:MAG TPA: HAMP domain-containing sensor histidine kinase [Pseudomonadota bacterium]|nr:HAMP domain-containing sensor histidine kinase [Pseudomonadota bacterium]